MSWIVEHADGDVTQHHEMPNTAGIDGGRRSAKTPRMGDLEIERWDWKRKRWIDIPEGQAARLDIVHRTQRGSEAITYARMFKLMEARLIRAGVAIDGLLKAEADAIGQTVEALASTVIENAAEFDAAEVSRIRGKRRARGN